MGLTLRGKHASIGAVLAAALASPLETASANSAVDRLFEQCARNLQRSADEIGIRCKHYLQFAGDEDDARRRQVQAYLSRAEQQGAAKGWTPAATPWRHRPQDEGVLTPDLLRREGDHRVDVVRTYGSAWEGALLRRAEAIYPAKRKTYCDERPGATAEHAPDWACGAIGPLRQAGVASAGALQYYLDWTSAASDPSQPVHASVRFEKSSLVYLSAIGYRDSFKIGKETFRRVYVAEVNLGWSMTTTGAGAKPLGFMLNKIVVFNGDGSVAALFDDHPINRVMADS